MSLPEFQLLRPRAVQEAVELSGNATRAMCRFVAGGTDLIPSMRQRLFAPAFCSGYSRDSRRCAGFVRPRKAGWSSVRLLTLAAIERNDFICRDYPVLAEAAAAVASPVLRQYGHDRRQHLPGHAMPLVQPVSDVAQIVRVLHQERWRSVPRGSWRNEMLGGVFRGHPSSAVLPGSGNGNCGAGRHAPDGFEGFLYECWRCGNEIGK